MYHHVCYAKDYCMGCARRSRTSLTLRRWRSWPTHSQCKSRAKTTEDGERRVALETASAHQVHPPRHTTTHSTTQIDPTVTRLDSESQSTTKREAGRESSSLTVACSL